MINGRHSELALALVIIMSLQIFILPIFSTLSTNPESWENESEGIIVVEKGVAEITSVDVPREEFKVTETVEATVKVKNTGRVDDTFYLRCVFQSPSTVGMSYSIPDEPLFIMKGESLEKTLSWTVPEGASPGTYSLDVILYDGLPGAGAKELDRRNVMPAIMIDTNISYIQIESMISPTGVQRAIHVHISKDDIVKSGTLTFLHLTYLLQVAQCLVPTGEGGPIWKIPEWATKLGRNLWNLWKGYSIGTNWINHEKGPADLLFLQVYGQLGFLYEARIIDIGESVKLAINPVSIIPKDYLEVPVPYFSILNFDKSILDLIPQIEQYFPYWRFSKNEKWYPCSFYFDNDANVMNNNENYDKPEFSDAQTGRPPYYVYVHIVVDANYLTIQYWLYFVYNGYEGLLTQLLEPHLNDWDARVFVTFRRDSLLKPVMVSFIHHISSETWDWEIPLIGSNLEKVDTHVVAYVAEGSHGSYRSSEMPPLVDKFEPGGITLGYENLTNWVIVGRETEETSFAQLGEYCLLESEGLHPTPGEVTVDSEVFWPKSFGPSVSAPWHQDETWQATVPPTNTWLKATVFSPVNICVRDSLGRFVGTLENGTIKQDIPGALYTGPDAEPETILINGTSGDYEIFVYGVSNGTFSLDVSSFSGVSESSVSNFADVQIEEGESKEYESLCPVYFDIPLDGVPCKVLVLSNSTISRMEFNESFNQVNFDVSGLDDTVGFCNVTIPLNLTGDLWNDNYTVAVDDNSPITMTRTENATHVFIYFTYLHSAHRVTILGLLTRTTPPTVSILSPMDQIYSSRDIPLVFTAGESTSWIGYGLDGQAIVTVDGNTTLIDLPDGIHYVIVHVSDNAGNIASSNIINFTVDTTPPNITNVSQMPSNVTSNDEVRINATVTDSLSGVKHVFLNYTANDGAWIKEEMTSFGGGLYNGVIDRFPCGTNVTYMITAEDYVNNSVTTRELGYECVYTVIQEFPYLLILPLFLLETLLAIVICKRGKLVSSRKSKFSLGR